MNVAPLALLLFAATGWNAAAQGWDTSGNKLLNGKFYFREVFYILQDGYGDLSQAIALYGTVTFDGNGNYTMTASGYDSSQGPESGTLTGTYSISASGYGFISNPLSSGDYVYGLVSQQGIFVGSSTESGFNDLFVAAPFSSQTALSTFKGSYWIADMDLSGFSPAYTISSMFQVNPDGAGNLGNIAVTGYFGARRLHPIHPEHQPCRLRAQQLGLQPFNPDRVVTRRPSCSPGKSSFIFRRTAILFSADPPRDSISSWECAPGPERPPSEACTTRPGSTSRWIATGSATSTPFTAR